MQILVNKNQDPRFIMDMIGQAEVMRGQDAFKYIHLKGLHLPLIMNEDLEYEEMEPFRANMLRQGAGMLKIAATFLERLERLGVYDETLDLHRRGPRLRRGGCEDQRHAVRGPLQQAAGRTRATFRASRRRASRSCS